MSEGLKPCPHCGSESAPELSDCIDMEACEQFEVCDGRLAKCVVCNVHEGGCGATGGFYPTKEEAIAAWNARAERTCRWRRPEEEPYDHGDWWKPECLSNGDTNYYCFSTPPPYCPNCGAKVVS